MIIKLIEKADDAEKFYNILKLTSQNSNEGLKEFYTHYIKFVHHIAKVYEKRIVTADDILDELFCKIWDLAKKPRLIKNPRGWLCTLTANCAKSLLRKEKRHLRLYEGIVDGNDGMENFINMDAFYSLLKLLDEDEKRVMKRKFIDEAKFKEIAKEMKFPIGTITSIYYRALKKIEDNIEKNP